MAIRMDLEPSEPLNMTPMIDVVFNLLIFFLLGSSYLHEEREISLELPKAAIATPITDAPDEIVVNVLVDGKITIRGAEVSLNELESRLTKARETFADQAVAVRGDANARYDHVAKAIAACRRAKIGRLDVMVQEP